MENNTSKSLYVAKTFKGLEEVLSNELLALGAEEVTILNRAVSFKGDLKLLYKTNLHLRTALRVLVPLHSFKATTDQELYTGVSGVDWSELFGVQNTLAIDAVVNSPYFNHSQFAALKTKDAIVDQFRAKFNKRPSINIENPTVQIHLHISNDQCDLLLDSSGESLHRRGYRINSTIAPLNEVLAAGMILLSGWDRRSNFIDPMCGSGTIAIEAALYAHGIPPGIFRKEFGFERWKDFNPDLFEEVYNDETGAFDFDHEIFASDVSSGSIRVASDNAKQASVLNKITYRVVSFEDYMPPKEGGIVMMNPPYGERMKRWDILPFYEMIGNQLKHHYSGYEAWVISSSKDALKNIGLRSEIRYTLFNGAIECKYQKYSIYEGTLKEKRTLEL